MNYRSKSISLAEDVWEAFDRAADVAGSYNKLLRKVLSAGGVFDASTSGLFKLGDESFHVEVVHSARRAGDQHRDSER